ncbi:MAG: hypothetical protein NC115_05150 [Bacteroidales bacterium]|nr:hypothetical protein [Bacteroidales bacterium]
MGVDAPVEAEIDLSSTGFTFQLPEVPADVTNLKLVILASAPQSNGVTRAYSKAVQIGAPREIVDTLIDIKAEYEAVHGKLSEANPKVFMKYFFVNSATGEKSSEMMALATYSA